MTEKERDEFVRVLEMKQKELANDGKAAKEFLVEVGILTKRDKKLSKHYQNLCIPHGQD